MAGKLDKVKHLLRSLVKNLTMISPPLRQRIAAYGGIVILLTAFAFLAWNNLPWSVYIEPMVCTPGQTIKVEVEGIGTGKGLFCRFNQRDYPFYSAGPTGSASSVAVGDAGSSSPQRALVPVRADCEPEDAPLYVIKKRWVGPPRTFVSNIRILPRKFRCQRLRLPRKKRKLYKHPEVKQARKKFGEALGHERPEQIWEGKFMLPLKSRITSPFGARRILSSCRISYHKGTDFRARTGTPVPAANKGVVALAGKFPLQGGAVVIDHGQGIISAYYHLSAVEVNEGDSVAKGDLIGRVGRTGISTGPHLHWAIFVHGVPVDPMEWTRREF